MNLQGQPGTSTATDRNKGLHLALDDEPSVRFVFEDTAGFDHAKALSMTESALSSLDSPPDGSPRRTTTWRSAPSRRCATAI